MRLLLVAAFLVAAVCNAQQLDEFELIDGLGYYKLYDNKILWEDAMIACYFQDAHLAIINSEEEAQALKNLMAKHSIPYYSHIGFSDLFKPGQYITVKGEPISRTGYSRWEEGFPGNMISTCGALSASGDLDTQLCTENFAYICERDISSTYDLVPGIGYYKVHTEEVTWSEAHEKCLFEGTKLAVINSDEEAAALAKLFESNSNALAHVGVHDRYYEAFYSTVDGYKIEESGYNKWTYNQPYKNL